MSNSIRILMSFFILAILLPFSLEFSNYQQSMGTFMARSGQVAMYLEQNGYERENFLQLTSNYPSIQFSVTTKTENKMMIIDLRAYMTYQSIVDLFSFLNNEMVYEVSVFRKDDAR